LKLSDFVSCFLKIIIGNEKELRGYYLEPAKREKKGYRMKVETINKYVKYFTDINKQEPPEDQQITVFCDDGAEEVGFIENVFFSEIGINMFITKKWILQKDLEELLK
jgi:hypothetical protein